MRKAFLFLVLIGAAFAGGAAVNGPGLRWAQAMILHRPSDGDDGTGDSPAADDPGSATSSKPSTGDSPPPSAQPVAPVPSLAGDSADPEPPKAKERPDPKSAAKPAALAELDLPPPLEPAASTPLVDLPKSPEKEKPPAPKDTPAWADAPGSAPAAAVPPRPTDRDPVAAQAALPAATSPKAPTDWATVRRKLRDLGVSQYGFDGDPNGKVRFHCVIPLAGRRAVGQHFEAEGDDEFQAAQTAMRRVALWRATENPGP